MSKNKKAALYYLDPVEFLFGLRFVTYFQRFFIVLIPLGAFMHEGLVWTIADLLINFMTIINMIGIVGLYKVVLSFHQKTSLKQI